jgi:hypothetical protein
VWLWRVLFPDDEMVIRERVGELVTAATIPANEAPLAKLGRGAEVAGFFTADAIVDVNNWERGRLVIEGRENLTEQAVGARSMVTSLDLGAENVVVTLGPEPGRARVRLTLFIRVDGDPERRTLELDLGFRDVDGEWLIQEARTVEYLKP